MSETYEGKAVRVTFEGARCIHSRNCVLALPEVFRPNVQGPWIDPDGAPADAVLALASRCPSGAIRAERVDGTAPEAPSTRATVQVQENGPYVLRGAFTLNGATELRATLCRCGKSNNKPYCDHSHVDGFVATGECATRTPGEWPPGAGVEITVAPDGPLLLAGPVEVIAGSGRTVDRGAKFALCRCGQSGTKPFCDGTHRKVGFVG
ncbi:MAG: CDGSH iron-sulfur domain-containing protein [Myxococcota bacterium]